MRDKQQYKIKQYDKKIKWQLYNANVKLQQHTRTTRTLKPLIFSIYSKADVIQGFSSLTMSIWKSVKTASANCNLFIIS